MSQTQEFWRKSNPRELMMFVLIISMIIVVVTLLVAQITIPEFLQNGFTTLIGFFAGVSYNKRVNGVISND